MVDKPDDATNVTAHLIALIHVGLGMAIAIALVVAGVIILCQRWLLHREIHDYYPISLLEVKLDSGDAEDSEPLVNGSVTSYGADESRLPVVDELVTEDVFPVTESVEPVPEPERRASLAKLESEPLWMPAPQTAKVVEVCREEEIPAPMVSQQLFQAEPCDLPKPKSCDSISKTEPIPNPESKRCLITPGEIEKPKANQCLIRAGTIAEVEAKQSLETAGVIEPVEGKRCLMTAGVIPPVTSQRCMMTSSVVPAVSGKTALVVEVAREEPVPEAQPLSKRIYAKVKIPAAFASA